MTDDPEPPYDDGTEFEDETGTTWTITGVSREYSIEIGGDPDDETATAPRTAYYPEDTLADKLKRGDLQVPDDETDEPPEPERRFECDECGQSFETERGLLTHQGKVHADVISPADDGEDDDDDETED